MLPIMMQFVGGIIAYYALRQDDPQKAKDCLLLGIVLTAIGAAMFLVPIMLAIFTFPIDVIEAVNN